MEQQFNKTMRLTLSPWPYIVTDGLIPRLFVDHLADHAKSLIAGNKFGLHSFNSNTFGVELFNEYCQVESNLRKQELEILNYFPQHRSYKQLDFSTHLAVQPAGYSYPTHCEHPSKIVSYVTYVSPEHSAGTAVHATAIDPPLFTVDWQVGRTLIFAGLNDVTWHSYASGAEPRVTFLCFSVDLGFSSV